MMKKKLAVLIFVGISTVVSCKSTFAQDENLADAQNYSTFSTIIYDTLKKYAKDMSLNQYSKQFDYSKPFSAEDFPQLFSMHLARIIDNSNRIESLEAKIMALHKQIQGMEDMMQILRQNTR